MQTTSLENVWIPERPTPESPQNVFIYQRGHERQIRNAEELCNDFKNQGFNAYIETDDQPNYCQQVASMYAADIIVSVDGSHNHLLVYARPGSTLIVVIPFNFRVPDWKLLGHIVGLRVLEYITLNSSYSLPHSGQSLDGTVSTIQFRN